MKFGCVCLYWCPCDYLVCFVILGLFGFDVLLGLVAFVLC